MAKLESLVEEFIRCIEEMNGAPLSRAQVARIRRSVAKIRDMATDPQMI